MLHLERNEHNIFHYYEKYELFSYGNEHNIFHFSVLLHKSAWLRM